jgi:hypothetical protein
MEDDKFILVVGNLSDGFQFYGPFDTFDEADEWENKTGHFLSWIATLQNPKE